MEMPEYSVAARSIYKTLLAAGFKVNYNEKKEQKAISRDIIFIASEKDYDFKTLLANPRYYQLIPLRFSYESLIDEKKLDISDIAPLTDDKPALDLLNKSAILEWRRSMIVEQRQVMDVGIPIY